MINNSRIGILCYGDSLTAGYCQNGQLYVPYSKKINEMLKYEGAKSYGLCGLTASQLNREKEKFEIIDVCGRTAPGFKAAINSKNYKIAVILAGTNDLGGRSKHKLSKPAKADRISQDIIGLHQTAIDKNMTTIAIRIPDSDFLHSVKDSMDIRNEINDNLSKFAESTTQTHYVSCPVEFNVNRNHFDLDGLHFSPEGYNFLGFQVSKIIKSICDELK